MSTFEEKYNAILARDPAAEGRFFYCVLTTNIFCRPTCSSRLALARNVLFCDTVEEARKLGFNACRRCKPDVKEGWNNTRERIALACADIGQRGKMQSVAELARRVGMSKWHFCRAFKNYTGVTPRKFQLQCRNDKDRAKIVLPAVITRKYLELQKKLNILLDDIEVPDRLGTNSADLPIMDDETFEKYLAEISSPELNWADDFLKQMSFLVEDQPPQEQYEVSTNKFEVSIR